jgi:hypothetical protein
MKKMLQGLILIFLLWACSAAFSYTVVLQNGKVVEGSLVDETEEMIVLKDQDGIQINFKKSKVDLEKTKAANEKVESETAAPSALPEKVDTQTKPAAKTGTTSKKPARVITEQDLQKLRDKYDLGEGLKSKDAIESTESESESDAPDPFSKESEDEWRKESQKLNELLRQAESTYNLLKQKCDELKAITVQTHILLDQDGQELNMVETTQQVCDDAERAKGDLEEARNARQSFEDAAKQEGMPPGWIRGDDEN